jgi:hypothetical protein
LIIRFDKHCFAAFFHSVKKQNKEQLRESFATNPLPFLFTGQHGKDNLKAQGTHCLSLKKVDS